MWLNSFAKNPNENQIAQPGTGTYANRFAKYMTKSQGGGSAGTGAHRTSLIARVQPLEPTLEPDVTVHICNPSIATEYRKQNQETLPEAPVPANLQFTEQQDERPLQTVQHPWQLEKLGHGEVTPGSPGGAYDKSQLCRLKSDVWESPSWPKDS